MTTVLSAGLGLKPQHAQQALAASADGLWFEAHPENSMVDGGPRLAWLLAVAERHPVSLHGVALSLAADAPPDPLHLKRLRGLVDQVRPALVSEHLAWSAWRGTYHPDLLPFPRTLESRARIVGNVNRAQDALGRAIALENPAHYLRLDDHAFDEIDFLAEIAGRTGCGLLLDVANVAVSAANIGVDAEAYLDRFPGELVDEIHLAGPVPDAANPALLIDAHGAAVPDAVWRLFERLVRRIGPRPTLIERDQDLPDFTELMAERARAAAVLAAATPSDRRAA